VIQFLEVCQKVWWRDNDNGNTKKYYDIMTVTIEIKCPHCQSSSITRNGKKHNGKQNYRCSLCGHQFIADHEKTHNGCLSWIVQSIKMMLVRGMGIRDISAVLKLSAGKVLKVLESCSYAIKPKQTYYDRLEIDEFWTYVRKKENEEPQGKPCGIEDFSLKSLRMRGNKSPAPPV
jgi:transposase-like protein